jgi:hypothetical protein
MLQGCRDVFFLETSLCIAWVKSVQFDELAFVPAQTTFIQLRQRDKRRYNSVTEPA